MAWRQKISSSFRRHLQRLGDVFILFLILVLSGCTHHKEHYGDQRDQAGMAHRDMASPDRSMKLPHQESRIAGHHRFSRSMEKELMLTSQQKEAFDRIETDYEKMVIKKTADIRAAEVDLANLLSQKDHDRQAIQEQVGKIAGLKEEMMMARIDSLLTLKALLTKGQYSQFQQILQERMSRLTGNSPHGSF